MRCRSQDVAEEVVRQEDAWGQGYEGLCSSSSTRHTQQQQQQQQLVPQQQQQQSQIG